MGTRIETTDAMFATVAEMLRFAYAMPCHVICKTQKFNDTAGGASELTPHMLHAQSSMIRAEVGLLPWIERNVIVAYYSNDPREKDPARDHVVDWLMRQMGALPEETAKETEEPRAIRKRRPYQDIVEMYCGSKVTERDLAAQYGMSQPTMHRWKTKLFKNLDQPYWSARGILRRKLVDLLRLS